MVNPLYVAFGVVSVTVTTVVVVPPSVLLTPRTASFRATFTERCEAFGEQSNTCENILDTFEQAYIGKEHCGFAESNYDQLFNAYPFRHQCGKTMLWSGTEDVIKSYAEKNGGVILGNTLLGHVLDDLEWCGQTGNEETYIYLCKNCKPNPVTSFWDSASRKFAQYACGSVTAVLDGEMDEPYYPDGTFGRIEVPSLQPYQVTHLSIILLTEESEGGCDCTSLGSLRLDLDNRIGCSCQKVTRSHMRKCLEQNESPPDDCLKSPLNHTSQLQASFILVFVSLCQLFYLKLL